MSATSIHNSPMLTQFLPHVCDRNMTQITSARDGDHKQISDATI